MLGSGVGMVLAFLSIALLLPFQLLAVTSEYEECSDEERVSLLQTKIQRVEDPRIPRVLILTGNADNISALKSSVRANVEKTIKLNSDLQVRWFNDALCDQYLQNHSDLGLLEAFRNERRGSFRGDICRAAALSKEGGFYQDVDVQLQVPFRDLVKDSTSFMAMWSADQEPNILNAVIAVEPGSAVMAKTIEHMIKWYKEPLSERESGWMGPVTLTQGVKSAVQRDCPSVDLELTRTQGQHYISCGSHNLRLYQEQKLPCGPTTPKNDRGCSEFVGLSFAYSDGTQVIGWPRFADCDSFGCGGGGWDVH